MILPVFLSADAATAGRRRLIVDKTKVIIVLVATSIKGF